MNTEKVKVTLNSNSFTYTVPVETKFSWKQCGKDNAIIMVF